MHKWLLLIRYARERSGILAIAFPLMLISCVVAVLNPWPMKVLVDNVLGARPLSPAPSEILRCLSISPTRSNLLMIVAVGNLLLFAVSNTVNSVLAWISVVGTGGAVYSLARDLFFRLQARSLTFHKGTAVGELMTRVLADSRCVQQFLENLLFGSCVALFTMVGMILLMARIDPMLTGVSLVTAPLVFVVSSLLRGPVRSVANKRREIEGRIQAHIQQTFTGVAVIQAFGQEQHEENRFRGLANQYLQSQKFGVLLGGINTLGGGLIAALGFGLVLWLASHHVLDGSLSLGSALLFVSYFGSLQGQIAALSNVQSLLQTIGVNINRAVDVLKTPPEVADKRGAMVLPAVRGRVELRNVTAGYNGHVVLKNVSFRAEPGEKIAVVGATGSGKTTLISLIPRFQDPSEGNVFVDDQNVRDIRLESLRTQVSIVPQDAFLCSGSVAENIGYGKLGASHAEIEAAARAACAHEFIVALPSGYQTIVGERGATLSGGMKQRIAIARALLRGSPILILDEPSSSLDAETERLLVRTLQSAAIGRTMFIVAHRLSTVRWVDRIIVMSDGEIVESGTHQELIAGGCHYARLHQMQSGDAVSAAT